MRLGDDALVELEVNDEIVVHADAQVALRPHTLFEGSAFVDLHPGSPSAPVIGDGDTIPRPDTRVYVSFDEALRVLREPVRERLRELVEIGADATGDGAPESLQRTLRGAPELTRDLGPTARALQGSRGVELARAISGAAATVDELARREISLAPLAERANRTLAALDVDGAGPLDRALAALPGPLETLRDRGELLDGADRPHRRARGRAAPGAGRARPGARRAAADPPATRRPALRRAVPLVHGIAHRPAPRDRARRRRSSACSTRCAPGQDLLDERVLPALQRESRLGMPHLHAADLRLRGGQRGPAARTRPRRRGYSARAT